ncbi:MAG: hypothetical protein U9R36_02995 [Elusimicrobiota bacterium]|nr:hypothetical protein [Elusimicrobiota bacterium]
MKKIILISLAFFVIGAGKTYGESSPLSDMYYIGELPGSDAIGRGGAFAGVMGSPFAPYWNPAGLAIVEDNKMGVSANLFSDSKLEAKVIKKLYALQDRKLNFISVAAPQVGVYWRMLSDRVDESTGTENSYNYKETIDENIHQFGVSVSVSHTEDIYFGMNINYLSGMLGYSKIKGSTPTVVISPGAGWGLDWGLVFDVSDRMNIGVTVLNAPGYMYWDKYSQDRLPLIFRSGVDLKMNDLMSFGIDYETGVYDDSVDAEDILHLGIEHYINKNFLIRGGMFGDDLGNEYRTVYTAGVGYKKEGYSVDAAAIQYYTQGTTEEEREPVRRFSISGVIPF